MQTSDWIFKNVPQDIGKIRLVFVQNTLLQTGVSPVCLFRLRCGFFHLKVRNKPYIYL